ncbi:S-layer homology domain-containing protein [Cohnella fermenti]|nr:S-layer homology domain-containing protein [Cohnella fermenti]
MKIAGKDKASWKKPLKLALAATLAAGLWPATLAPQTAEAATAPVGPGGVAGVELWLRPDAGIAVTSGGKVALWQDQSAQANNAKQDNASLQPTYRDDVANNVNFNPVIDFNQSNTNYLELDVAKLPAGKDPRTIVTVAETRVTAGNHYIISWGTGLALQMMGMLQIDTTGSLTGYTNHFQSGAGFWQVGVPNELFGTYDGITGALYSKMEQIAEAPRSWNTIRTGATVGSMLGSYEFWEGTIGDLIVYDRVLSDVERQRISSYLSLKYGYTIDSNDYLDSTGDKVWDSVTNATYHHNIGGIARDDASALNQKQSNSTNSGNQVIIGLGGIEEKNSDNTAQFLSDKQYLVWGDNNQPFAYTVPIGDRARTQRVWKIQNTGNVGLVEFAIPRSALPEKGALLVGNADFSTATEHPLTLKTINGQPYYTTQLTFTDGQYFTLVTTKPELETVSLTQTLSGGNTENKITLDFDQSIKLSSLDGFTITVDDIPVSVTDYTATGNQLVLTLPQGTIVTGSSKVVVNYDQADGNLAAATTNLAVSSFSLQAIDPFAAALTIDEPSGTTSTQSNPAIKGKAEAGSTVSVAIKGKDGNPVAGAGGAATVDAQGNWTFTPGVDLASGEYTIEVTAEKDNQIASKVKELTVIDKSGLQASVTEASGLLEEDYTPDSWTALQNALEAAQAVLENEDATQDESDGAQDALRAAVEGLEAISPNLVSVALSGNELTLAFDLRVSADDVEGLTITVDGQEVELSTDNVALDPADPKKVIVTLPGSPNGSAVLVSYDSENGGLLGRNGAPVESFGPKEVFDPFVEALSIDQPADLIASVARPTIAGEAEAGSTVTIVIKDSEGTPILNAGGTATVDDEGNWTFTSSVDLPVGEYTIEAMATNNGHTATKTKDLTVVDKSGLQASVTEASGLLEEDYAPDSWTALQNALRAAQDVWENKDATQDEIDAARDAVRAAIEDLEAISPNLVSVALSGNELTLTFDLQVSVDDVEGLTITVDGESVPLSSDNVAIDPADPKKVIVTLPEGPNGSAVLVSYDSENGGLQGRNGAPVESFEGVEAIDPFVEALIIEQPVGSIAAVSNPTIAGKAAAGSTVTVVIKAGESTIESAEVTVDAGGNWTFTPSDLVDGEYTIEVTADKDGLTASKTKDLTIVDKSGLQASLTEASGLLEEDYTADSWTALQNALEAAQDVWENEDATQDEIDDAQDAVRAAVEGLEANSPNLVSVALSGNELTLTFDLRVSADDIEGLTVTVDGESVTLSPDNVAVDSADPKKLIVTLPESPNGSEVLVSYEPVDSASGGLQGLNGAPVNSFGPEEAVDPFIEAFVITRPTGSSTTDSKPTIAGKVTAGSTVTIVIKDKDGSPLTDVGVEATVDAEGNWTFTPSIALLIGNYTIEAIAVNGDRTHTISKELSVNSPGGWVSTEPKKSGIETSVNGADDDFATGTTSTTGDLAATSVQVDNDKLNERLSEGSGQKLAIRSAEDGDLKVDGLTAADVKLISDKSASLHIENLLAIYPLPSGKLNLNGVSGQLGNAALADIAVHIDISRSSDTLINNAKSKAAAEGYELLVTPVDLNLTFSNGGRTIGSEQLNGFAPKYIALPDGIDPSRITTGVIVNPDGGVFHVPTVVTKINNRYYAMINDLRSSGTYSVIWNPQDFDDVKNHWGQADVNNIAARLDLKGTGNNTFSPNRNVTRSEFAEIVVAGLGLMRQNAPDNQFPDVSDAAWYRNAVAIASEFGIVRGFDNGNFYGNNQITREQGFAMIARALTLINPQSQLSESQANELLAKYEDAASVSAWARADVAQLISAGIVNGTSGDTLNPKTNMTRAEVTALIARLLQTNSLIDK